LNFIKKQSELAHSLSAMHAFRLVMAILLGGIQFHAALRSGELDSFEVAFYTQ